MKTLLPCFLLLLLSLQGAWAQTDTLKYRVMLADKVATTFALERPEEFLSDKALERRQKQWLTVDSTDLPVCRAYIDSICSYGVHYVTSGKWDNFVTVSCNDSTRMEQIACLPFVRSVKKVWVQPHKPTRATKRHSLRNTLATSAHYYGTAEHQIALCNGIKLHEAGFKGQGITIAVIDAGYHNFDSITSMHNIQVLGVKDFADPGADIFAENDHGMKVLSCMGMNQPYAMVGTAPEASYWLLRSEDDYSEQPVEQDYWAAAVEYADSVGADMINTSLGYYKFDNPADDVAYDELDGHTHLMSRQASRIAGKGMVMVCGAGNAGNGPWKKITIPSDAEYILTVGAVDAKKEWAYFSGIGPTADGRVKPDVVAMGVQAAVMKENGTLGNAHGTSFASPILCGLVACLWQARPELTAFEVIELVRRAGNSYTKPTPQYGYGLPDMWKARKLQLKKANSVKIIWNIRK